MVFINRDSGKAYILLQDLGPDNSNKTHTALRPLEILGIRVELTTTITAGNRQISIQAEDATGDVFGTWEAAAVQAASDTVIYEFYPGAVAGVVGGQRHEALPVGLLIGVDQVIRVGDSAGIASAADDMLVHIRARRTNG